MPYYVFNRLIKNPKIKSQVIKSLPYDNTCTLEELNQWIELSDKDQFKRYACQQTTFA